MLLGQFALGFLVCFLMRVKNVDNIILNYLFLGVTIANLLICFFPPEVMLTIRYGLLLPLFSSFSLNSIKLSSLSSMAIAGSDCIQYFAGKAFGKTKIVPKISPNKSLEGYVAAVIGCNIIHFFLRDDPNPANVKLENYIFVNGMLFVGIVGDLFISWWKRKHQLKDTSHLLTAHGGFLDRYFPFLFPFFFSLFVIFLS